MISFVYYQVKLLFRWNYRPQTIAKTGSNGQPPKGFDYTITLHPDVNTLGKIICQDKISSIQSGYFIYRKSLHRPYYPIWMGINYNFVRGQWLDDETERNFWRHIWGNFSTLQNLESNLEFLNQIKFIIFEDNLSEHIPADH